MRDFQQTVELLVYIFSVTYFKHGNYEFFVRDRIDNAIAPLTNSVLLFASQLFTTLGSRIRGQPLNLFYNAGAILLWEGFDLLDRGRLDVDLIACHVSSDPSGRLRMRGSVCSDLPDV